MNGVPKLSKKVHGSDPGLADNRLELLDIIFERNADAEGRLAVIFRQKFSDLRACAWWEAGGILRVIAIYCVYALVNNADPLRYKWRS